MHGSNAVRRRTKAGALLFPPKRQNPRTPKPPTTHIPLRCNRRSSASSCVPVRVRASRVLGSSDLVLTRKLILRSRLILRDTHRLDVCGTRLGSTDQALIMSLSSAGGMKIKIKIKKRIKITHACRRRQIVGLVLILDPRLRQST